MAGALVALIVNPDALRVALGAGLIALAAFILWNNLRRRPSTHEPSARPEPVEGPPPNAHPRPADIPAPTSRHSRASGNPEGRGSEGSQERNGPTPVRPESVLIPVKGGNRRANEVALTARDGREYRYTRPGRTLTQAMGAAGAFLQGLMGAGLPEVTTTQLLLRGKLPPRIAVATSVTTLTVTVFFAALIHALGGEPPWHVALWSCPGALTGAQFGARLQAKLPPNVSQRLLAAVFACVGVVVIALRDAG